MSWKYLAVVFMLVVTLWGENSSAQDQWVGDTYSGSIAFSPKMGFSQKNISEMPLISNEYGVVTQKNTLVPYNMLGVTGDFDKSKTASNGVTYFSPNNRSSSIGMYSRRGDDDLFICCWFLER